MAEPTSIVQGDSATWLRAAGEYPAPTWTLTYHFASPEFSTSFTATDEDCNHRVTLTPAATLAWRPGVVQWQARVTDGTDVWTVGSGRLCIEASIATTDAAEFRTFAENALAAVEAVILGKASRDQQSYSIAGRSLVTYTFDELLTFRARMRAEVAKQQIARDLASGTGAAGRVMVRL